MLSNQPKLQGKNEYELGTIILPMSINRFYSLFVGDDAPYGIKTYQEQEEGSLQIELSKWVRDEQQDNNTQNQKMDQEEKGDVYFRRMDFVHPV